MLFTVYYLKEGDRIFDRTDLLTFFQANPNITLEQKGTDRHYIYRHPIFQFSAEFILSGKSAVPHLERLNPKYYDVNFRFEFDILLPTYYAELVLDIAEEIAKIFHFCVYNESYEDVVSFRKPMLSKTFEIWKNAYKNKNEDEIAKYSRIDSASLSGVYNFILRKPKLEVLLDKEKVLIPSYFFMRTSKSRTAFICIKWDGNSSFILPPNVDILYYDDFKTKKYIAMSELLSKAEKLFKTIDAYGTLKVIDTKASGKLKKLIYKTRFAPLTVELKEIALKEILDI